MYNPTSIKNGIKTLQVYIRARKGGSNNTECERSQEAREGSWGWLLLSSLCASGGPQSSQDSISCARWLPRCFPLSVNSLKCTAVRNAQPWPRSCSFPQLPEPLPCTPCFPVAPALAAFCSCRVQSLVMSTGFQPL